MPVSIIVDELVTLLQCYLVSDKSLRECAEWLAGVDWDDPALTDEEKETIGLFEVLITEIAEGMRKEVEFQEAAADFIGRNATEVLERPLPALS